MSKIRRIYLNKSVYEQSLDRVRWLFDEFPNVVCAMSGGKDSTIALHLALKVAEEKNRLPLRVMFLDQEAEYRHVIEYIRRIMSDDRVEPYWVQAPFKINNATSHENPWLYCWEENGEWMREKESYSIKENTFGFDTFHNLFNGIVDYMYPNEPAVLIGGLRAEESPARNAALINANTYKGRTWGKILNKKLDHYTFYPIYDWSYTDVWKCINKNKLDYCKIYDLQYQYGVPVRDMRVSNLHHETALHHLFFLQEVEPDTWNKLVKRLNGINTTGHLGKENYQKIKKLPYMFKDWIEYRDFLLERLITDSYRESFKKQFDALDNDYEGMVGIETLHKLQVTVIITNDFEFTKIKNFKVNHDVGAFIEWKNGRRKRIMVGNKYIPQDNLIQEIIEHEKHQETIKD